jgi:hypothetical protein
MGFRETRSIRALIGAILLIALLGMTPTVAEQAGGSQRIVSGQTVTWSADWTLEPDVSMHEPNVELLALSRGADIVGYGGTSVPVGAGKVRDTLLGGFASGEAARQVDRGDYDNVSYSIDLSTSDGVTLAIFTLVIENPTTTSMAMLISKPDAFEQAMTAAQAGITIDGAPIFDGVDAAQMQATIAAAQPADQARTPAPQPTETAGGLGDLGDAINGTATPDVPATTVPADAAPANGVTLASSGVEVRYSDDWSIQRQNEANLSLGTVGQPVVLLTVIDLGPVPGSPDASTLASGLQEQVESLADAEAVAALNPSPDRMVIVFRDPDTSGTLYRVYDIALDPVATTAVTMIVGEGDLGPGVDLVSSTIRVDGAPVFTDLRELVPHIFAGA